MDPAPRHIKPYGNPRFETEPCKANESESKPNEGNSYSARKNSETNLRSGKPGKHLVCLILAKMSGHINIGNIRKPGTQRMLTDICTQKTQNTMFHMHFQIQIQNFYT